MSIQTVKDRNGKDASPASITPRAYFAIARSKTNYRSRALIIKSFHEPVQAAHIPNIIQGQAGYEALLLLLMPLMLLLDTCRYFLVLL